MSAEALRALLSLDALGQSILDGAEPAPETPPGVLVVGVCRGGATPSADTSGFDILLSDDEDAPAPWVGLPARELDGALAVLEEAASRQPLAASVAAQVLRIGEALTLEQALVLESMAYSMLLASAAFRGWRVRRPAPRAADDGERVRIARVGDRFDITLTRPDKRNAVDARMRDALVEALTVPALAPETRVTLRGEGPCFSAGGDLDEFGSATDAAAAHAIRTFRSPARLLHRMRDRATVLLHGACIGAGIEIPAAAGRVIAAPDTVFRLPEVGMGLIPGAGGTATIPRRIGRQRAAYLAISGAELDAKTALAWGLIDAIEARE